MLRNYIITALRNLVRNKLYAAINIVGLAVGFGAALLIALYVRDELTFDRWIAQHEQIYRISSTNTVPGRGAESNAKAPAHLNEWLTNDLPGVASVTRLMPTESASLRHGDVESNETNFYWADPNFFAVMPLPVIAGDPQSTLSQPDGVVLTRSVARKYFGRDAPIGETLELNRQYGLKVGAVIADLPSNTHLAVDIVVSGLAPFSDLAKTDADPVQRHGQAYVYVRATNARFVETLRGAFNGLIDAHMPPPPGTARALGGKGSDYIKLQLTPIAAVHFEPTRFYAMKPPGDLTVVFAFGAVALLIVSAAGINFVNLMTAQAARRAIEVGVRKVSGARRRDLFVQFVGEALIYVFGGMAIAVLVAELLLPAFNAFLDRTIAFEWWREATVVGAIVAITAVTGILAALYPALVLSAFRPAVVMKSGIDRTTRSGPVRQVLVVLQFAILVGMMLVTSVIYRQTHFAMERGLRFEEDQVLVIRSACSAAFRDGVQKLEGVEAAACSSSMLEGEGVGWQGYLADHTPVAFSLGQVDPGFFKLYGLTPIAGRTFMVDPGSAVSPGTSVVMNEAAMRKFGYPSAVAAIGKVLEFGPRPPYQVIGVVPDFSITSVRHTIEPFLYLAGEGAAPANFTLLNVRLSGPDIPQTLQAIDRLWNRVGERPGPIIRFFVDQYVQKLYLDINRQSQLLAVFTGVALVVAALGLFGVAAFTAELRTKEIGVRKAMGASRVDILRLLLWQFAKPVLWANLLAWPVAAYLMHRWLQGFAYHVELDLMTFVTASALALAIALATVSGHVLLIARARPASALRYE